MTVTMICDVLGEENNGTTVAAMNLLRALRAKGHTVRVVCPDRQRAGQQNFFVLPTTNLGPFNHYVEKNGVTVAKADAAPPRPTRSVCACAAPPTTLCPPPPQPCRRWNTIAISRKGHKMPARAAQAGPDSKL